MIGLRFKAGPLVASFPLTGRRKSGSGSNAPAGGGGLIYASILVMRWVVIIGIVALIWPYLALKKWREKAGLDAKQAQIMGIVATGAWLFLLLIIDAIKAIVS